MVCSRHVLIAIENKTRNRNKDTAVSVKTKSIGQLNDVVRMTVYLCSKKLDSLRFAQWQRNTNANRRKFIENYSSATDFSTDFYYLRWCGVTVRVVRIAN